MRGVARQEVGCQGQRPADGGVAHCGMKRRLSLLFLLPVGMRTTHDGISELQFISVAKGMQLGRRSRRVTRRRRKS